MQLKAINQITGKIVLVTGLHIGAGNEEVHIGGIDNGVIKHPHTQQPYIPGSSLKGKMRSLLEWRAGVVGETKGSPISIKMLGNEIKGEKQKLAEIIVRLFGAAGDSKNDAKKAEEIGITRLSFWDCRLNQDWADKIRESNQLYTEAKTENTIDRITGVTVNGGIRQTERVPAGAIFDFTLGMKILNDGEEDFVETMLAGLKLLELDGIGGSGSRGYGKIKFVDLKLNGKKLKEVMFDDTDSPVDFEKLDPFNMPNLKLKVA